MWRKPSSMPVEVIGADVYGRRADSGGQAGLAGSTALDSAITRVRCRDNDRNDALCQVSSGQVSLILPWPPSPCSSPTAVRYC
jgi:hypothetical protein